MKPIPMRLVRERVKRAQARTTGFTVRVSVAFSRDDLVHLAAKGFPVSPAGLRSFVRDYAVARDLRWLRDETEGWALARKSEARQNDG